MNIVKGWTELCSSVAKSHVMWFVFQHIMYWYYMHVIDFCYLFIYIIMCLCFCSVACGSAHFLVVVDRSNMGKWLDKVFVPLSLLWNGMLNSIGIKILLFVFFIDWNSAKFMVDNQHNIQKIIITIYIIYTLSYTDF